MFMKNIHVGAVAHSIDKKGHFFLPKDSIFKAQDKVLIMRDTSIEGSVYLSIRSEESVAAEIQFLEALKKSKIGEEVKKYEAEIEDILINIFCQRTVDQQGRIGIPKFCFDTGKFLTPNGDVIILGMYDRLLLIPSIEEYNSILKKQRQL